MGWFSDSLETRSRDGLARALEAIAAGQAATLYVRHRSFVASSLGELSRLLDWLEQSGASLVASDVGLDTSDRAGRRSVALLREVDGWGRVGDERRRLSYTGVVLWVFTPRAEFLTQRRRELRT